MLCPFCSFNSVWFSTLVNIIIFPLFNNHDHFHSALLLSFLPGLLFMFQKKFSPACLFRPSCSRIFGKQPACLLIPVCSCIRDFRVSSEIRTALFYIRFLSQFTLPIPSKISRKNARAKVFCGIIFFSDMTIII